MSLGAFGSIAGGLMGMSAAHVAMDAIHTGANGRFNLAKPYISDMYRGGADRTQRLTGCWLLWWPDLCRLNQAQQDAITSMETLVVS